MKTEGLFYKQAGSAGDRVLSAIDPFPPHLGLTSHRSGAATARAPALRFLVMDTPVSELTEAMCHT